MKSFHLIEDMEDKSYYNYKMALAPRFLVSAICCTFYGEFVSHVSFFLGGKGLSPCFEFEAGVLMVN